MLNAPSRVIFERYINVRLFPNLRRPKLVNNAKIIYSLNIHAYHICIKFWVESGVYIVKITDFLPPPLFENYIFFPKCSKKFSFLLPLIFAFFLIKSEFFCQICIHKLRKAKAKNYQGLVTKFLIWLQIFQKTIFAPILISTEKSENINKRNMKINVIIESLSTFSANFSR